MNDVLRLDKFKVDYVKNEEYRAEIVIELNKKNYEKEIIKQVYDSKTLAKNTSAIVVPMLIGICFPSVASIIIAPIVFTAIYKIGKKVIDRQYEIKSESIEDSINYYNEEINKTAVIRNVLNLIKKYQMGVVLHYEDVKCLQKEVHFLKNSELTLLVGTIIRNFNSDTKNNLKVTLDDVIETKGFVKKNIIMYNKRR